MPSVVASHVIVGPLAAPAVIVLVDLVGGVGLLAGFAVVAHHYLVVAVVAMVFLAVVALSGAWCCCWPPCWFWSCCSSLSCWSPFLLLQLLFDAGIAFHAVGALLLILLVFLLLLLLLIMMSLLALIL